RERHREDEQDRGMDDEERQRRAEIVPSALENYIRHALATLPPATEQCSTAGRVPDRAFASQAQRVREFFEPRQQAVARRRAEQQQLLLDGPKGLEGRVFVLEVSGPAQQCR